MLSVFGGFNRKIVILFVLLIMLLVVFACRWWQRHSVSDFPVNKVQVKGEFKKLSALQLQSLILPFVDRGFFQVDRDALSNALTELPWVDTATVKRIWPGRVDISITERRAVARWNEQGLVNAAGLVFSPAHKSFPKDLPQLVGPTGQAMAELAFLQEANALLKPAKLSIAKITLTEGDEWSVQLNNGMKLILGHEQLAARLKRFIAAYPRLFAGRAKRVEHVNLCYSHSMAVQWKK